ADGRSWLWVRVDRDVLRGAEAAVPLATVELVGLRPHHRRTFSSRFGPVTLVHDGDQTTRGSVRAVALAAGAGDGDTLLLGFSGAGDFVVEVHRPPGQPAVQQPPVARPRHPGDPEISTQGAP
ncbi:MAG: hypothetical protein ACRDZQ_05850, partial [Acidimicrobiales bacterium]